MLRQGYQKKVSIGVAFEGGVLCMQTSHIGQTSTRQVMNRLRAFSGSPAGLSPAFTVAMVQQAIDDCLALQGREAFCEWHTAPSGQVWSCDICNCSMNSRIQVSMCI